MNTKLASDLLERFLVASERALDIPETSDVYGWLVGTWRLDVLHYWGMDVSARGLKCDLHAAWVLEGRAVQDVWIMPALAERRPDLDKKFNMYGTTLRVWDPQFDAWRITWKNPAGNHFEEQIGRRQGDDIVQLGMRADGTPTRWRFTEISPRSFHWLGESLAPDGATWRLEGEFRGNRAAIS